MTNPTALRYEDLTLTQLRALPRDKTAFAMAMSPIEVHGPHLPLGTDVAIARGVRDRSIARLAEARPDLTWVILPDLYLGSDALPVLGSLGVSATALEGVLWGIGSGLAAQGFRYLLVCDNHGGPGHQMAVASAVTRLWRRRRFHAVVPFLRIYREMVDEDGALQKGTGLGPGHMGDDADAHAGTNETSLFSAVSGVDIESLGTNGLPPNTATRRLGLAGVLARVGGWASSAGLRDLGRDLRHVGDTLEWTARAEDVPYRGAPAEASRAAGDAMLTYHVDVTVAMVVSALRGDAPGDKPVAWTLRALKRLR